MQGPRRFLRRWRDRGGEGGRRGQGRGGEENLTEVVQGVDVFRIERHGALEGQADFDSEAKRVQGVGVRRLKSVGATEPQLIVTAGGVAGCGELTFADSIVAHVLSIV